MSTEPALIALIMIDIGCFIGFFAFRLRDEHLQRRIQRQLDMLEAENILLKRRLIPGDKLTQSTKDEQ